MTRAQHPSSAMLKLVFFDAAGTLFHPRQPVGLSYARMAERFGLHADVEAVAAGFHRAFDSTPGLAFGPGHSAAELRALERRWWRTLVANTFAGLGDFNDFDVYFEALFAFFADPANWQADPEAPRLLQRLKDNGFSLGVISNFDARLYRILEGLGLRALFDSITISSEAGFAKPSPELFKAALAVQGAAPEQALHVGDSERMDAEGATAVGMAAVLLDPAWQRPPARRGGSVRVGSLASVFEVAQRLRFA